MALVTVAEGRYVEVNASYGRLLDYAPGELVGQTFPVLGLVHQEERALVMDVLRRAGRLGNIPLILRTRDGEARTAIGSVQLEEFDGQPHFVLILQDLTEYERVQSALQSVETRFRYFFQGIPLPLLVYDATSLQILDVNPAACRTYGYTHNEFLRRTLMDLVRGETAREPGSAPYSAEAHALARIWRHHRKDGSPLDGDVATFSFHLDGRPINLSILQDITEQRAREAALHASREQLQIVAEVMTDAIWDRDLETDEVQWNQGLNSLFGFEPGSDQPHGWWLNQVHPEERAAVEASINEVFASGGDFWTREYRFRRADGRYVNVLDRGHVFRDRDGRPRRFIGAMVDITAQLAIHEVAARAAQEERQRLARDLHEAVTQSLYSTSLMAEAARRHAYQNDLDRAADYIARLGETSRHALRQLRLLVYQLRPSTLEQEGLVNALRFRLEAVEQRAGVRAHLIDETVREIPSAVAGELFWVAQEALNNSLRHANATTTTVSLREVMDEVWIEIRDNGQGFTVGDRHLPSAGLASLRERVARLGGVLEIESRPGEGTLLRARVGIASCDDTRQT